MSPEYSTSVLIVTNLLKEIDAGAAFRPSEACVTVYKGT
jgi:hypothetical protein